MTIARKIKQAFRGHVSPGAALLEISRRSFVALCDRYERARLHHAASEEHAASLRSEFASMPPSKLLEHFQTRPTPRFFGGFDHAETRSGLQSKQFPVETVALLDCARNIVNGHRWPLLGYGVLSFGKEIDWLRDPVSGALWPLDYHADVALASGNGGDVRVLWELNRLGHLITLGRAYSLTRDERYAEEFFAQVRSWKSQNRFGFGPNWTCAMEVALRAMNLLAGFQLLKGSANLTAERLLLMLSLLEQHGRYIQGHLEFSHIATSNHYLSDVVGLFWLGICLPEFEQSGAWRALGLREMLREMDKQILPDGADYEASTGYHRFVLELFLFSFLLCQANSIEIADRYWEKLRSMLKYVRAYLRPDGGAPLIGDSDGGQVMPIVGHPADDHRYLLAIGAVLFNESNFKLDDKPPQELLCLMGEAALETFRTLATEGRFAGKSAEFSDAGTYVLRNEDLYLLFNVSGTGLAGRGAHAHNDVLSVEVAACGTSFLSDPGTYVYTSDLAFRQRFRSTGYHSTVEVDGIEQNTIDERTPFHIGHQARPRVLRWESTDERDLVIAEHYGYERLRNGPIVHRRSVIFDKVERYWLIEDALAGSGEHVFRFCFHVAPGLEIEAQAETLVNICDNANNARLIIAPMNLNEDVALEPRWFSRDYGVRIPSIAACWTVQAESPLVARWLLLPIRPEEDEGSRLRLIEKLRKRRQPSIENLRSEISESEI